jgi:hypothetical protein
MSDSPRQPASPPEPGPRSTPPPNRRPAQPRVVVKDTSKRDMIVAVGAGLGVLAIVLAGIFLLHGEVGKPSDNQLTGVIVARHDSGEREQEISFGKKGLKTAAGDTGFTFDVRVESEGRTYVLPVNEGLFRSKKVGDSQTFIRPRSEQR